MSGERPVSVVSEEPGAVAPGRALWGQQSLGSSETTTLADCETVIERGLATFADVGEALLRIRDERLYRETHGTFEDYCRERWGMDRTYAHRTMQAATVSALLPIGNTPPNEAVARELAPLRDEPDTLREAWGQAVEQHGEQPTAAQVRDVVTPLRPDRMAVHYSSETDDWATPQDFYDVVNQEFGFELDVCALSTSAKCERHFTPEDDGLAQDWTGVCWMNPPYGDEIRHWIKKAHDSAQAGATVVCLVPARVDTGWWWDYCRHGQIRFIRGRLRFGTVGTGAPFPSALVVFSSYVNPGVVWWEWK